MSRTPNRRLEEIASQSDFVHELAGRLLTDHARAEDVAQATLASALGRAPENGLRAWLAAVVRNLASKNRRSVARRFQREARSARRDRAPSSDEVIEREHSRQRIIEAVEQLPREQRQAVLLRFFEGLPPRTIAEQLNIPLETVKTRLKRGLENLRPKLIEEDPRSGLAGLALVACGSPSSSWVGGASESGIVLMTNASKLKLVGLVAVASSIPFAAWLGLRSLDQVPDESLQADVTALVQNELPIESSGPSGQAEGRRAIENTAARDIETSASLVGRVLVKNTERPVAGVVVQLTPALEGFSVNTDENGDFELDVTDPIRIVRAQIGAGAATAACAIDLDLVLTPGESRDLVLYVGRGATMQGVVLDEEDRPVAGAEVLGWCTEGPQEEPLGEPTRRVTTDGEGRFSLGHTGAVTYVEARADGLVPTIGISGRQQDGDVADGLVLRLTRSCGHTVRVLSPERTPVEGADVRIETVAMHGAEALTSFEDVYYVRPREAQRSAKTDHSGISEFRSLAQARHRVLVEGAGYATWAGRVDVGQESWETLVVLTRGMSLNGRVLAIDGTPVAGAEVKLRNGRILGAAKTDTDGRFSIGSLQGRYGAWLSVQASGHAVFVHEPVVLGDRAERELTLVLENELAITGAVLFPDGSPASGVSVTVEGERLIRGECTRALWQLPTWESQLTVTEVDTDEQGQFSFGSLYEGMFRIAVAFEHQGVMRRLFVRTRAGAESLSIVLDPAALEDVVFEGRVSDATTGAPVEAFTVTVMGIPADNVDYNSPKHEFRSTEGRFVVGGFTPMNMALFVSAPGFRDAGAMPEPRAAGRHRIDVELFPTRSLSVRVIDQHGRTVSCGISVNDSRGKHMWLPIGSGAMASNLSVGADGLAILQNLPASPVQVTVWLFESESWPANAQRSWQFPFDLALPLEGMQDLEVVVPD